MWGSCLYFVRVDLGKQRKCVACLVISPLGLHGNRGPLEGSDKIVLGDCLHMPFIIWECVWPEFSTIEGRQGTAISEEPCLHGLDHEKYLLGGQVGEAPSVPLVQVGCGRDAGLYRTFGIDQQNALLACLLPAYLGLESVERLSSSPAGDDFGLGSTWSDSPAVFSEALPAPGSCCFVPVSSTLDINGDGHQRFPPISPLIQRLPRE